ncbi:MAG: M4 family metallopeptidase [Ramlibacter sp.]|nr:M4 family metallopeptidase [Ramlibacter sp.]
MPQKKGAKLLHRQVFDAEGQTFLPGKLLRDEDDPPTSDKIADQAYENIGIALQFFSEVFGRDSVDGKGLRIDASVHYGYSFANAMWTGEQMIVGDGDGQHIKNLAGSLGIVAHEFSHGVSQHLVPGGLGVVQLPGQPPTLKGEAGALNESFSDVCASMVKQWHAGEAVDAADWLLGEDILAPHAGKAVRSLKDPGNKKLTWIGDDQISDYKRFRATDEAHKASGIANRAFYLAAMALGGNSWETLGKVWLGGFDKLRARSTFLDAAHATVDVATALCGKGSETRNAVKSAWKRVNVLS